MASDIDQVMPEATGKVRGVLQTAVQGGYFMSMALRNRKAAAQRKSEERLAQINKQIETSHNVARPVYRKLMQDRFYLEGSPEELAAAYQTAQSYSHVSAEAAQVVDYADEKFKELYDFDAKEYLRKVEAQEQIDAVEEENTPEVDHQEVAQVEHLSVSEDPNAVREASIALARSQDAQTVDVKENREASNLVENSDDLQMDPTGDRVFGAAADAEVEDAQQAREMRLQYKDMENAMRARHGDQTGVAVTVAKAGAPGSVRQAVKKPGPTVNAPKAATLRKGAGRIR